MTARRLIQAAVAEPGAVNTGILTLDNSKVNGNTSGAGGGIFNNNGTVTLAGSFVTGNTLDNCEPPGSAPGCTG